MQGQDTQNQNVVSIFAARNKAVPGQQAAASDEPAKPTESFDNVMERNAKNQERMAKERANANKSVLRSYRIKN